jgi:hypothetical protein
VRGRVVTGAILFSLIVLLVLVTSTTAKNESSCVTCYTDEAALKKLCKVPEIPTGEAEG